MGSLASDVQSSCLLPRDVAVLCADCATPVPLIMFVADGWPRRQVRCPSCACEFVLRDAW